MGENMPRIVHEHKMEQNTFGIKQARLRASKKKDKIEAKCGSLSFPPSAREPLQSFFSPFALRLFPLEADTKADTKADIYRKGKASVRLPKTVKGVYATKSL